MYYSGNYEDGDGQEEDEVLVNNLKMMYIWGNNCMLFEEVQDLFHDNKPTCHTLHKTMEIVWKYCMGSGEWYSILMCV